MLFFNEKTISKTAKKMKKKMKKNEKFQAKSTIRPLSTKLY